ncbi:MAG: hypothetical protein ABR521_09230 [Gaiellaceae bacterium]
MRPLLGRVAVAVAVATCLAATVTGFAAADASGANIAPNPSFQDTCGSATKACHWPELNSGSSSFQRDPSLGRTDTASYRFFADETSLVSGAGLPSDCREVPLAAGSVSLAFWYRTTDDDFEYVSFALFLHSQSGCNSFQTSRFTRASPPTGDGEWHRVSGAFQVPASGSFFVHLGFGCQMSCGASQLNWDDVVVEQVPTAVAVSSVEGHRRGQGTLVRWQTTHETSLLGFNLYRQQRTELVKLNRVLIPSVFGGTPNGHDYSWFDRRKRRGAIRYRLQSVAVDGERRWVGTAVVA